MMLLKNVGVPRRITVYLQKNVKYLDKKGNKHEIIIIAYRDGDTNEDALKFKLLQEEKMIMYKINEQYTDKRTIVDVDYSFEVIDYPHILNFPIGTNKYNERKYNLYVDEVVKIENDNDGELLVKTIGFLNVVNEKGETIREGRYKEELERPVVKYRIEDMPKNLEVVPDSMIPRANPKSMRVSELVEDKTIEE